MKGSYILIIFLNKRTEIEIGKLGTIDFHKGYYAYVGSGMNSLEKRVERHRRKEKKIKWHIDYFLNYGKIKDVMIKESKKKEECGVARKLAKKYPVIKRFGSSDCSCKSHLFYLGGKREI